MTSLLSCVVAALALGAEGDMQGLPFGIPPAPEDAVIASVAPPHCLFYVNWAGTASPSAASTSETEKLLAEPEVQGFIGGLSKAFAGYLRRADEEAKKAASAVVATPVASPLSASAGGARGADPSKIPPPKGGTSNVAPPAPISEFNTTAENGCALYGALLTHPTAIFITDFKAAPPKSADKKSAGKAKPIEKKPQTIEPEPKATNADDWSAAEIHGGMVVSLGPDAARLRGKFFSLLKQARKAGKDKDLARVKIAGKTWYRSKPAKPGDKNIVTFGFHGKYFVLGVGEGAVEGILARWNSHAPAWLTKAMAQTEVPRRTGIIYLNLKVLRDKLLPLAADKEKIAASLELLGLDNVDSLVSTTGLEDYGMISRTLLALDGKPRGLLDLVADRPLTAKDLGPIPSNALVAFAARIDLDRSFNVLLAACEKAADGLDAEAQKNVKQFRTETLEKLKKEYGIDIHRFLSSIGDTWCVYNSPTEGEIAFLGWTAVVSVRDRAALVDSWEKICAASAKKNDSNKDGAAAMPDFGNLTFNGPLEFRKCQFAGRDIYYIAGQVIAPAFCISDREMVMTLNMPAMKAYLTRKDHRSLATLPGVALALSDRKGPASLSYVDTPKLFDFLYPLISFYANIYAGLAHQAHIDLDPTFWPSAPAIRAHLRPDITTVQRTPGGLQITSRYCLPWGGATSPFLLMMTPSLAVIPFYHGDPFVAPQPTRSASAIPTPGAANVPTPSFNAYGPIQISPLVPAPPAAPNAVPLKKGNKGDGGETAKPTAATSQIYFAGPEGLTIQWETTKRDSFDSEQLVAPVRHNFPNGDIYRLKLTNVPGRPGADFYAMLEVHVVPHTEAFLKHHAIPLEFTKEDFDEVTKGKSLAKVVYLPDPEFQKEALAGVGTLVSTKLDRSVDPVEEAERRGTIMAILWFGTSLWDKANGRVPIMGPYHAGAPDAAMTPPSDKEVMRILEKARPVEHSAKGKIEHVNVRIVTEMIQESVDPARIVPLVGPVQLHHVHWKCVVYFTEVKYTYGQVTEVTMDADCREVIYIDHDHLHRVKEAEPSAASKT